MKKILKHWEHIPGVHCGSVALRDVAHYYESEMTEEACFGLGGGLGFYYTKSDEISPTRSIHLRGPGMEVNFLNHYGNNLTDWIYEDESEKALTDLISFIDEGIPVLIQTDIFYLDYYSSSTHFPGHIVVVCGYDDEKEVFYLSDTAFEGFKEVPFESLKNSRNSRIPPYPLRNNYIGVRIDPSALDLRAAVPAAIYKNADMMYNGASNLRGSSGIVVLGSWAKDLPHWADVDDWKWSSRFAYQVISKRGVDGGGFRWMYRDFLNEMSEYCPLISELDLSAKMDRIGREWNRLSEQLKKISELPSPGNEFISASQITNEILTLESDYYYLVLDKFEKI